MKHRIDPKIDCVFNALLGAERNRRLLIHLINAILAERPRMFQPSAFNALLRVHPLLEFQAE